MPTNLIEPGLKIQKIKLQYLFKLSTSNNMELSSGETSSTFKLPNPRLLKAKDVTHMIYTLDNRAILLQYQENKWSVPVTKYIWEGIKWAPEISVFAKEFFKAKSAHVVRAYDSEEYSCEHIALALMEFYMPDDIQSVKKMIESDESGQIRLVGLNEIDDVEFALIGCKKCQKSTMKDVVKEALREIAGVVSPVSDPVMKAPWTNYGWIEQVRRWISKLLSTPGHDAVNFEDDIKLEVVSNVNDAMVMRITIPGRENRPFFRASLGHALHIHRPSEESIKIAVRYEVRLLNFLSENYASIIPRLLACEMNKGWMLLEGITVDGEPCYVAGLQASDFTTQYAEFQKYSAENLDSFLDIGCPDRRPKCLREHVEKGSEEIQARAEEDTPALSSEVLDEIERQCNEVESVGIPCCLLHGDLHGGNILMRADSSIVLIDWNLSYVSNPLLGYLSENKTRRALYLKQLAENELGDIEALVQRAKPLRKVMQFVRMVDEIRIQRISTSQGLVEEAVELLHDIIDSFDKISES